MRKGHHDTVLYIVLLFSRKIEKQTNKKFMRWKCWLALSYSRHHEGKSTCQITAKQPSCNEHKTWRPREESDDEVKGANRRGHLSPIFPTQEGESMIQHVAGAFMVQQKKPWRSGNPLLLNCLELECLLISCVVCMYV